MLSGAQPPSSSCLNSQVRKPTALANVTIDLYKGGGKVADIAAGTPNNGSYTFQAPGDEVANGGDYKVRISASTDPSVFGESEYFWVSHAGNLNATSNPPGAAIYWDGRNSGQTTDAILTLPVGSQTVKYTRNLFRDFETNVNILKDQTIDLYKALDPDSFFNNFNDNQAPFWTLIAGSADLVAEDGVFKFKSVRGSSEENVVPYKAGSAKFYGNFTYEVDAERAIGESWHVLGIAIGVEENHYRFILLDVSPGDQDFSIWYQRATGGQQGTLTGWTTFSKIHKTGMNDLKIIRDGNTLFFYINEYEVAVHTISYLEDWVEVGLWGYTYSLSNEIHFDNIRMTMNSASPSPGITNTSRDVSKVTYDNNINPAYPPRQIDKKIK
jgi:hypothetical protein